MATGLFNLKQVNQAISQGAWSGYIAPKWVEYLVVAGGGGGGSRAGGGGGAGGLLTGVVSVAAGTSYTVTVGTGGAGGVDTSSAPTSGNNSVLGSISSAGGGYGSSGRSPGNSGGASGGSGGGGSYSATSYGQGASGQGNAGSAGLVSTSGNYWIGGSGGGAGTVALNGVNNGTSSVAGYGGAGIASSISGSVVVYAGGGGGGCELTSAGTGGVGGGGSGGYAANGTAGGGNTGGGGGGGGITTYSGGNGGSGIVVVRYPGNVQFFTGGTVNYNNGYIIHIFTSSGTLAPTTPTVYNTSYQISRSLRFNSADSAYLNRTPASATNRKTWTFSAWVKRSALSTDYEVFSAGTASPYMQIFFRSATGGTADTLSVSLNASSVILTTTQVFRDVSAWYHIVAAVDTTQATSSDRIKLYVNGSQVTAFNTANYPSQNYDTNVNNTQTHAIGGFTDGTSTFSGYMTEVNFIDGQALTPSSFGATSTTTGVWAPIQYTGTYGTNGFYLNFSDNSNTTAATLGKDYSGNGNNWTPNNFSVTAGAGNDSLIDSPTAYGFDTGVGGTVRGNYATLNPLVVNKPTLTNGNLDADGSDLKTAISTMGVSSGKWYWEVLIGSGTNTPNMGVTSYANDNADPGVYLGVGRSYVSSGGGGGIYKAYTATSTTANSAFSNANTAGATIGFALDCDAGTLAYYVNNVLGYTDSTIATGTLLYPMTCNFNSTLNNYRNTSFNFGQRPFAYTAPSGYKALCTQNLPTPTIGATSTTQASSFFAPVLYTGTGATQSVTVGFQPDFTWFKVRNQAYGHALFDSVRGAGNALQSNNTNAEAAWGSTTLTAFTSTGLTLGADTSYLVVNSSGNTFVAWNWRAGNNAGSTNTAGSITSTVSANTTSGFSVVTYTGTGTTGTIGHGLGVAPSMIIVKCRSTATTNWYTYHISIGNTGALGLNLTDATITSSSFWNNTSPTSSVFTISGASGELNGSGRTYVAYAFAEVAGFSKIGSYIGNGSADGPFIYCGFRPAFVMFKNASSTGAWGMYDRLRAVTYNPQNAVLYPNYSNAENIDPSYTYIDFVSNGIKIRSTGADFNFVSGNTYIFMAFAENPFKTSLAR